MCHAAASRFLSASRMLEAGIDEVHYVPLNRPHNSETVRKSSAGAMPSCLSLAMMQPVEDRYPGKSYFYVVVARSVKTLYGAGGAVICQCSALTGVPLDLWSMEPVS